MPIPSVVIEPASSNEGDDDRDGDISSPIATSGNGVITECQTTKDVSSEMPLGFLFKVNIKQTPLQYRIKYVVHLFCNNYLLTAHYSANYMATHQINKHVVIKDCSIF